MIELCVYTLNNGKCTYMYVYTSQKCSMSSHPHTLTPSPLSLSSPDSNLLPTSFSTDVLLTPDGYQRPLSIFSVRPSVSMVDTSLAGQERGREGVHTLSPEVRHRKLIMGIGHFNKSVCVCVCEKETTDV